MEKFNILQELHSSMINLPVLVREQICSAFGWSFPTFYRKMKATDTLRPPISKVEAKKIRSIVRKVYKDQLDKIEAYED